MPSHPFPFGFKLANLDSLRSQVGGGAWDIHGRKSAASPAFSVSDLSSPASFLPLFNARRAILVWRPALAQAQTASKPLRAQRGGGWKHRGENMVSAPSVLHYLVLPLGSLDPSLRKYTFSCPSHPHFDQHINSYFNCPQREPCKGAEQHDWEEIFDRTQPERLKWTQPEGVQWTQPAKWKQRDIQVLWSHQNAENGSADVDRCGICPQ